MLELLVVEDLSAGPFPRRSQPDNLLLLLPP